MNKNQFKGWSDVYSFTFRQATKSIGFKFVTALIAILIIAALIIVNILTAKPKDEEKKSPITEVFVVDESGLAATDFHTFLTQMQNVKYTDIQFHQLSGVSREQAIQEATIQSDTSIAVIISAKDSTFQIEACIPEGASITQSEGNQLLSAMISCFETNKLMQAGLTNEQLMGAMMPVITSYSEVGGETNVATQLIKYLAPMLFGLVLYFMLLIHGQTISKEVSTEKTSKLMETLLTSVHPYSLITGKILAISSMALMQFAIWIIAILIGLYGGNVITRSIYPEYQNTVIQMIDFLKDNVGETALSVPAIILAIIIFCSGFLFYCVLAGLAGCMATKPEEVASMQGIFQFPIVISWLICYLAPILGKDGIMTVARFVPFTAPFCVPVELITGSLGLLEGVISAVLILIFSLLVIMGAARIYKGMVLYNGQKVSLKIIGNILRAKQ